MSFLTTKKVIIIFSNGSLNYKNVIIKKLNKISFYEKDHENFIFNQKDIKKNKKLTKFKNFKSEYLKY